MTESITNSCEIRTECFNELDSQSANNEKTNRRNYRQIYRKEWETNPLFKGWLSPVLCDKYKAVCIACKKELLAHRLTLLKHASSAKHLTKLDLLNKTTSLSKSQSDGVDESAFKINDVSLNRDCNSDTSTELVKLENVTPFSAHNKDHKSLNSLEKGFASEMVMSQAETSEIKFEKEIANIQPTLVHQKSYNCSNVTAETVTENLGIFIQTEAFVDISDSPEAINFKPGYVAKNYNTSDKTNAGILSCASAFLADKMGDGIEDNVLSKITTYPLQVSTRVTDYSRGVSVSNVNITLYKLSSGKWMCVAESTTDEIGRCNFFPKSESYFATGCYKLHYDVATYYEMQNLKSYFPFIEISFLIRSPNESHHIPLMISPNGYTAYRSLDY